MLLGASPRKEAIALRGYERCYHLTRTTAPSSVSRIRTNWFWSPVTEMISWLSWRLNLMRGLLWSFDDKAASLSAAVF